MKKRSIKLGKIRLDGDTQPRAGINTTLVAEYATAMEEGNADFPPAVVFFDGTDYWLADGFHRWHAVNKNDVAGIYCEIHDGTVEDARWYSYSVNQAHGQRRNNADKEKAVKAALLHPKGAGLSDKEIGEYVGVSHSTVAKYRAELESTCQIGKSTARQGRDGRTIDTSNIGGGGAGENEEEEEDEPVAEEVHLHVEPDEDVGRDDVLAAFEQHVRKAIPTFRQLVLLGNGEIASILRAVAAEWQQRADASAERQEVNA